MYCEGMYCEWTTSVMKLKIQIYNVFLGVRFGGNENLDLDLLFNFHVQFFLANSFISPTILVTFS